MTFQLRNGSKFEAVKNYVKKFEPRFENLEQKKDNGI